MQISSVGIWAEDPVSYEPDGDRYEDHPKQQRACDEDQLAAESGPDDEQAADAG